MALVNVDPMLNCLNRVCVYDCQKYSGFMCKEVMYRTWKNTPE